MDDSAPPPAPDAMTAATPLAPGSSQGSLWARSKARLKALFEEYGTVALVVWFTIFGLTVLGFSLAIRFGYQPEGAVGTGGILGTAYLLTQATKPLRVAATVALTPLAARAVRRFRRAPPPAPLP